MDLLQAEADMLRQDNRRLRIIEEEALSTANQLKMANLEVEQLRKKLEKFENQGQEKERENQELHEDNYDLSQTVQHLKEEIEKIEREIETGDSERKFLYLTNTIYSDCFFFISGLDYLKNYDV